MSRAPRWRGWREQQERLEDEGTTAGFFERWEGRLHPRQECRSAASASLTNRLPALRAAPAVAMRTNENWAHGPSARSVRL